MKLRLYFLLITLALAAGCQKTYKYVDTQTVTFSDGRKEQKENRADISADSDTAAYLEAFRRFCVTKKVFDENPSSVNVVVTGFTVTSPEGADLRYSMSAERRESAEKVIMERIFGSPKQAVADSPKEAERSDRPAIVDAAVTAKIKSLSRHFKIEKDEFSEHGATWYTPASAPKFINQNGLYCYFLAVDGKPETLRFSVQYAAEDWLFFSSLQFVVDGKVFEYQPVKTKTDSGNGGQIWEWFDEALSPSDFALIRALADAKAAKVKFIGKQYDKVKPVTLAQIQALKETLDLYDAMGGE